MSTPASITDATPGNFYYVRIRSQPTPPSEATSLIIALPTILSINDTGDWRCCDEAIIALTRQLQITPGRGVILSGAGGDEFAVIMRERRA